jgi:hypothetical protein
MKAPNHSRRDRPLSDEKTFLKIDVLFSLKPLMYMTIIRVFIFNETHQKIVNTKITRNHRKMKKILLLLPIIGICSSLFAQAPQVQNVNANQKEGTKFVIIQADISGKEDPGGAFGGSMMFFEVWFKQAAAETSWQKVSNLKEMATAGDDPTSATDIPANESFNGAEYQKFSYHLNGVGSALTPKVFVWDAGAEISEYKSDDAVIKIIAFYPKKEEFGGDKPADQQVSGWDGTGEFNLGGDPGTN